MSGAPGARSYRGPAPAPDGAAFAAALEGMGHAAALELCMPEATVALATLPVGVVCRAVVGSWPEAKKRTPAATTAPITQTVAWESMGANSLHRNARGGSAAGLACHLCCPYSAGSDQRQNIQERPSKGTCGPATSPPHPLGISHPRAPRSPGHEQQILSSHRGRFRTAHAQRGHSTNHYGVHPGNTPANHPPTEASMIHSKPHRGCRIQDPGTRGYRW